MYVNKNYEILLQRYPKIYKKIVNIEEEKIINYQVVASKNGYPTIKINNENKVNFIHSKYNPINEAKQMVDEYYNENIKKYLICGFGLGYHVEELIKKNFNHTIFVYEANKYIFKLALDHRDLSHILKNPNIHLIVEEDITTFAKILNQIMEIDNSRLIIHTPSLRAIPQSLIQIRYLLEDFKMKENTIEKYKEILDYNFNQNITRYDYCVSSLFNKFEEIPIIIISAGPSLQKNIKLLKDAKDKAILIAVGTAVKPLLKEGIKPDIIIITDPQDVVANQLKDISIDVPIIALSTVNYNILKNYEGVKFIAMQKGYFHAEEYVKCDDKLVNTGGSVATTALDICLKFGCNPIIFVGQDLAFTNGESHIKGTQSYKKVLETSNLRPIKGYYKEIVYTSKNLFQYLKWIERRIEKEEQKLFIDATEGGAFIEGTVQMNLSTVISKYLCNKTFDFKRELQKILKSR